MVEAFGKDGYKYNAVNAAEFNPGDGGNDVGGFGGGKMKHGGAGSRANKSNNYKEAKKANIRRNEKRDREAAKEENKARQEWVREENKKW